MKILVIIWCLTIIIDNLLPLILARFYSNFSHKEMALSVLGSRQSPVKWVYNVWCILSGIIFCIAPYTLYYENRDSLTIAIWVLLASYGIGCEVISGFCPLNENRYEEDVLTKIHGGASAIGFMTLLVVPLLLTIKFLKVNVSMGLIALVCFILSFVFFVFFIIGEKKKFRNTVLRYSGLWQRLVLLCCYVPLFVWCIIKLSIILT